MSLLARFPCLSVTQPLGTFYLTVMKAGELLRRVDILRRGLDAESQNHVQRELSGKRAREIASYVGDPDATFPTSIIVSARAAFVHVIEVDGRTELVLGKTANGDNGSDQDMAVVDERSLAPLGEGDKIGDVIDGQHRLMGLVSAGANDSEAACYCFELPVVFMIGLEAEERAYVFATINSKQTRVSSSLIVDLFGLATSRSPRKTCHDVASALNADAEGPFFGTLKMLGKKNLPTESLTQGSFAKYLARLISRAPDDDERAVKLGRALRADDRCPFRQFFLEDRDDMIVKIMSNYFCAVREVYPTAWGDAEAYALRRTVGFAALVRAFRIVWEKEVLPNGNATLAVFRKVASRFAASVPESSLKEVSSNEQGASDLSRRLTASWLVAGSDRIVPE
jgi:DGQHR domain-containing protein